MILNINAVVIVRAFYCNSTKIIRWLCVNYVSSTPVKILLLILSRKQILANSNDFGTRKPFGGPVKDISGGTELDVARHINNIKSSIAAYL